MQCPKCKFVCSDSKDACPRCGLNLAPTKRSIGIRPSNEKRNDKTSAIDLSERYPGDTSGEQKSRSVFAKFFKNKPQEEETVETSTVSSEEKKSSKVIERDASTNLDRTQILNTDELNEEAEKIEKEKESTSDILDIDSFLASVDEKPEVESIEPEPAPEPAPIPESEIEPLPEQVFTKEPEQPENTALETSPEPIAEELEEATMTGQFLANDLEDIIASAKEEAPVEEIKEPEPEVEAEETELLSATPFVAPKVMEFDDSGEDFESQMDALIGDVDLNIESVAAVKEDRESTDSDNSFLLDDDMEVSIEFEVEGLDVDEDESEDDDENLSGLVDAFESIGDVSSQSISADTEAQQTRSTEQSTPASLEQELAKKDLLIQELATLVAEAYGISADDILKVDPLTKLEQELDSELDSLLAAGTSFLKIELGPEETSENLSELQVELDSELYALEKDGTHVVDVAEAVHHTKSSSSDEIRKEPTAETIQNELSAIQELEKTLEKTKGHDIQATGLFLKEDLDKILGKENSQEEPTTSQAEKNEPLIDEASMTGQFFIGDLEGLVDETEEDSQDISTEDLVANILEEKDEALENSEDEIEQLAEQGETLEEASLSGQFLVEDLEELLSEADIEPEQIEPEEVAEAQIEETSDETLDSGQLLASDLEEIISAASSATVLEEIENSTEESELLSELSDELTDWETEEEKEEEELEDELPAETSETSDELEDQLQGLLNEEESPWEFDGAEQESITSEDSVAENTGEEDYYYEEEEEEFSTELEDLLSGDLANLEKGAPQELSSTDEKKKSNPEINPLQEVDSLQAVETDNFAPTPPPSVLIPTEESKEVTEEDLAESEKIAEVDQALSDELERSARIKLKETDFKVTQAISLDSLEQNTEEAPKVRKEVDENLSEFLMDLEMNEEEEEDSSQEEKDHEQVQELLNQELSSEKEIDEVETKKEDPLSLLRNSTKNSFFDSSNDSDSRKSTEMSESMEEEQIIDIDVVAESSEIESEHLETKDAEDIKVKATQEEEAPIEELSNEEEDEIIYLSEEVGRESIWAKPEDVPVENEKLEEALLEESEPEEILTRETPVEEVETEEVLFEESEPGEIEASEKEEEIESEETTLEEAEDSEEESELEVSSLSLDAINKLIQIKEYELKEIGTPTLNNEELEKLINAPLQTEITEEVINVSEESLEEPQSLAQVTQTEEKEVEFENLEVKEDFSELENLVKIEEEEEEEEEEEFDELESLVEIEEDDFIETVDYENDRAHQIEDVSSEELEELGVKTLNLEEQGLEPEEKPQEVLTEDTTSELESVEASPTDDLEAEEIETEESEVSKEEEQHSTLESNLEVESEKDKEVQEEIEDIQEKEVFTLPEIPVSEWASVGSQLVGEEQEIVICISEMVGFQKNPKTSILFDVVLEELSKGAYLQY